jgi:RNA polymerase sigma factor (sigma-70 family)
MGLLDRPPAPDRPAPSSGKAPGGDHRSSRAHRARFDAEGSPVEDEVQARLPGPAARALLGLSADQRAVILLRIVADLSVAEVAEILGKSQGGVKTLQRRGLRALSKTLKGEGVS